MQPTSRKGATYADLEKLPEHVVGELIDGELFVSPRPALLHASVQAALVRALAKAEGPPGGTKSAWRILVEPELHLGKDVIVPDLAGWRWERMPKLPRKAFCELAPDWVCEIISPATARVDRVHKLPRYARARVPNAWIIDPPTRTVDVLRLSAKKWMLVAAHTDNDRAFIEPFVDHEMNLQTLWPDETPTVHSREPEYES